ncbi:KREPA4 [Novymonas esmeraldas]|uniref:KREPA4 n=1 Tax=Novymonas esmeraldas TaxID=1808958 RepID=A0AAW0EUF0_9TRYP
MRSCPRWSAPLGGASSATMASARGALLSLREATRLAKSCGGFGTSSTPSSSPLRRSTDAGLAPGHSDSDGTAGNAATSWAEVTRIQRQLFTESHSTMSKLIAVSVSSVNMVHLSVKVRAVHCGFMASNTAGPSGSGVPGRRTVVNTATTATTKGPGAVLLLWVSIDGPELLAVRCVLSRAAMEATVHSQQLRLLARTVDTTTVKEAQSPVASMSEEELQRRVKLWAEQLVLDRRVLVSGRLRMEDVYDGDLQKVVPVPVVEVPPNNFAGSVRSLPSTVQYPQV